MMKSEPATAPATPQTTPRISSKADAASEKSLELQEPVLMHLSPPVLQVSELSKPCTNPLVRVCTSNSPPEGEDRSKAKCPKRIPPPAHIPKPKASSDPNLLENTHSHTHLVPEVGRIPRPYGYTINSELESASVMGKAQDLPWISRLQVIWDNCVKSLTLNPFRKAHLAEKASDCNKANRHPQLPQLQEYGMEEQPSQECIVSKIWWDLPMTRDRIRNRSSLSYSNSSSNQNDCFISDKMMDSQQTRIYGLGENIDTDVNTDDVLHPESLKEESSGNNKAPQLPTTKSREYSMEQRLPLVHEVQQNKADEVSRGPHDSTFAYSSAACVVTLNQEAEPNELNVSEQPQNNVHKASTTSTGIEEQNMITAEKDKPTVVEDDCWVHQWLASYSAQK